VAPQPVARRFQPHLHLRLEQMPPERPPVPAVRLRRCGRPPPGRLQPAARRQPPLLHLPRLQQGAAELRRHRLRQPAPHRAERGRASGTADSAEARRPRSARQVQDFAPVRPAAAVQRPLPAPGQRRQQPHHQQLQSAGRGRDRLQQLGSGALHGGDQRGHCLTEGGAPRQGGVLREAGDYTRTMISMCCL
jgi:hypothetical protein